MEFNDNNGEQQEDDYVEIYSKKAIFWFAVFSTLYAGILLILNLRAAGYKTAVYRVLIFTIVYAVSSNILTSQLAYIYKISFTVPSANLFYLLGLSIALNVIGGLILTQFFFKRYFPDEDYYPKSIQMPLFIFIGFALVLSMLSGRM